MYKSCLFIIFIDMLFSCCIIIFYLDFQSPSILLVTFMENIKRMEDFKIMFFSKQLACNGGKSCVAHKCSLCNHDARVINPPIYICLQDKYDATSVFYSVSFMLFIGFCLPACPSLNFSRFLISFSDLTPICNLQCSLLIL